MKQLNWVKRYCIQSRYISTWSHSLRSTFQSSMTESQGCTFISWSCILVLIFPWSNRLWPMLLWYHLQFLLMGKVIIYLNRVGVFDKYVPCILTSFFSLCMVLVDQLHRQSMWILFEDSIWALWMSISYFICWWHSDIFLLCRSWWKTLKYTLNLVFQETRMIINVDNLAIYIPRA